MNSFSSRYFLASDSSPQSKIAAEEHLGLIFPSFPFFSAISLIVEDNNEYNEDNNEENEEDEILNDGREEEGNNEEQEYYDNINESYYFGFELEIRSHFTLLILILIIICGILLILLVML